MRGGDKLLLGFLLLWLLFNWLTAAALSLDADEAYYWMYSRRLDFGYFDHPPAIALLIRMGSIVASGEWGIRLFVPVMNAATFFLLWDLLGRPRRTKDVLRLILLFAAMPLLQVYAFVATPDVPLLFFTTLFWWVYQRFADRSGLRWALLLGVVMAAMLYSKYHGVLIIFFTLLSNLRLLRQPYFYVAAAIGVLLFLPHLYWQYVHDFPSFRYHLSGRDDPYELKHTGNYLLNQLLIFSPLLFPLIIRTLWRRPASGLLERSFKWVIFGFWGFFLYTTFKGHVEPQWTVLLSIPFIVFLYRESCTDEWLRRWVMRMAAVSAGLLLLVRIALIWPDSDWRSPFHQTAWIEELRSHLGSQPVVFQNSYRRAALYEFYTGRPTYTFTDYLYRPNQYDIWDGEKTLHNRSVWMIGQSTWKGYQTRELALTGQQFRLRLADSLQVAGKVRLQPSFNALSWTRGDTVDFRLGLHNPYPHDIRPEVGDLPLKLTAVFDQDKIHRDTSGINLLSPPAIWPANTRLELMARLVVPATLSPGNYQLSIGLRLGDLPPAYAGKATEVSIEK